MNGLRRSARQAAARFTRGMLVVTVAGTLLGAPAIAQASGGKSGGTITGHKIH